MIFHCSPVKVVPHLPPHLSVECVFLSPAGRCGITYHLHFHTHPLPSSRPLGDAASPRRLPSAITAVAQSCVCAAQLGSRWSLVQVRGALKQSCLSFLAGGWSSTGKHMELSQNTTWHQIHKNSNYLNQTNPENPAVLRVLTDWHKHLFVHWAQMENIWVFIPLTFNWQHFEEDWTGAEMKGFSWVWKYWLAT